MRREITDAFLRTVEPPAKGRLEVWDTKVPGLVWRITSTGTTTWGIRSRTKAGKRTRPKLGTWPALGIAAARKDARATIAAVEGGGDPVAEKRDAKAARKALAQRKTVATAMAEWQLDRAAGWSDRYASEVKRIVDVEIAPSMGNRALKDTTREDWTNLVAAKKRKAPAMASSIYRTIAAFLGHAEAQGWIDSPLLPRKGLTTIAPAAAARGRVLTDDELKAVLQAADKVSVKCKTFIWLLAATAVREAEAADISIGELDLVNSVWTIAGVRTKNGQTLAVPLPNNLVAALHGLYPTHVKPAASWKLLGAISGSGFRGFSKLKATIDRHSGVGEWRWHDLRRTARTGMTRLGVSREHAEAAINHISGRSKLERTYNQHDYGPEIIAALKRWQNHVAAIVSEQPTAAIVQLRRGL